MFDPKTIEAYHKIKPSDSLRERVLKAEAPASPTRILNLRKYGNLAACFVLTLAIALFAGQLASADGSYVALADGSTLSAVATPIESVTVNYTGAARISFRMEDTQATTYPDPVEANGCFYFELHAESLTALEAEVGSVFLYDKEAENYVDYGSTAFFEGKAMLYWHVPEIRDGETFCLTLISEEETTRIVLTRQGDGFTVSHTEAD